MFADWIYSLNEVQELIATADATALFLHLVEVSQRTFDEKYENPWDTALTTYFLVLKKISPVLVVAAVEWVADTKNIFWARFCIEEIRRTINVLCRGSD